MMSSKDLRIASVSHIYVSNATTLLSNHQTSHTPKTTHQTTKTQPHTHMYVCIS